MRNFQPSIPRLGNLGFEPDHFPRNDSKTPDAPELNAFLEKDLQAQAYPQKGFAALYRFMDDTVEFLFLQVFHAIPECADPGKDDRISFKNFSRFAGDGHRGADRLKSLRNGPQVAHAVVNNGDHLKSAFSGGDFPGTRVKRAGVVQRLGKRFKQGFHDMMQVCPIR